MRIRWSKQRRRGWLELSMASSDVVVGVWLSAGRALRLADERAKQQGGLLGAPGACWCHWTERRCSGARTSSAMADGGSGYSRGSGYGTKTMTWLRGKGPGAHVEAEDRLSWLGDDRKATNPSMESGGRARGRRLVAAMWGSRGGVARGGRKRGSRRRLWAGQRSEGEAVAAATANGVGGSLFGRRTKRERGK